MQWINVFFIFLLLCPSKCWTKKNLYRIWVPTSCGNIIPLFSIRTRMNNSKSCPCLLTFKSFTDYIIWIFQHTIFHILCGKIYIKIQLAFKVSWRYKIFGAKIIYDLKSQVKKQAGESNFFFVSLSWRTFQESDFQWRKNKMKAGSWDRQNSTKVMRKIFFWYGKNRRQNFLHVVYFQFFQPFLKENKEKIFPSFSAVPFEVLCALFF